MAAEARCYGIVERLLGAEYCGWFDFCVSPKSGDYYVLSSENGKIRIEGNNGVSIASGLKYYLKQFCGVYIGQQTIQNKMPEKPYLLKEPIRRKAYSEIRYAYNYCTLSYSMPFWDEERWQRELDWLALSGVNLVLDFTGIEEVWYRFLSQLGYEDEEIRKWIVSPCYAAWQQMQNMEQFGAALPRQFLADRAELARKNQRFMADMGMTPVRQGYGGMVPSWHETHAPSAKIFHQGEWNGLARPAMLDISQGIYQEYAELFYQIQEEVLGGGSHYYAVDVFHEGGIRPKSLSDEAIAETVLKAMLAHDPKAVWVIQAWHENPTGGLLAGISNISSEHALILDLSATDNPQWIKNEFMGTPWVYCMLDMYGGRVATHGEADTLAEELPRARQRAGHMKGIGFTSEATLHNPVVFDLLLDMAWEEKSVDLEKWLRVWLAARYGQFSNTAFAAWKQLLSTAYKNPGYSHHGGYTQIFTFRPRGDMEYGEAFNELNSSIIKKPYYDTGEFEKAVFLLAETKGLLSGNESWCYDMQDFLRQVLNNRACKLALDANAAKKQGNAQMLEEKKAEFFALFHACDKLMSIRKDTLLSDWLGYAYRAGLKYGQETSRMFLEDAKTLITSWANEKAHRTLADYSYRQYGGMLEKYYLPRWELFFEKGDISEKEWYEMAQKFIKSENGLDENVLPAAEIIDETLELLSI